jgi:Holliday junction resolvase RusA-like endonuclease
MTPLTFTLSICPQTIQTGNRIGIGKGGKAIIFSSKRKKNYQFVVQAAASRYRPSRPITGPVKLDLIFILPRPKRLMGTSDPDGWIPHPKRPDRDNLVKGTQDALSAAGFWLDDAQICDGRTAKYYAERGGSPRIIVSIEQVS